MRFETDTTICAIATGTEGAPRGIIRITGPDTIPLLKRLFDSASDRLSIARSAQVIDASLTLPRIGAIPVAIFCWPTHRSYTGQPSAELHMIGAPVLMREVEGLLIANGARLAQGGEFTLRAYLAGRMDLTQCEAVLGLIHAKGDRAFRVALEQLAGGLAQPLKHLRRDLINLLADFEAGLDFVDEDIEFVSQADVLRRLSDANSQLLGLQKQLAHRSGLELAPRVVLAGLPNAGKSSLFNALCRAELAIASQSPGTTRDYLRSRVERRGILFDLIDTAGIDRTVEMDRNEDPQPSQSTPASQAQGVTVDQLRDADLVLYCTPSDIASSDEDRRCLDRVIEHTSCDVWRIVTKSDLIPSNSRATEHRPAPHSRIMKEFHVSAVRGDGLSALLDAMAQHIADSREKELDVVPMTGQRCRDALERAIQRILDASSAAESGAGDEVVAGELRMALDELGQVAGAVVNNDVLDALFSRFCIGK